MRAQLGGAEIESQRLAGNLHLLTGPGGNVLVLNGTDGKLVVDTFVSTAWGKFRGALSRIGPTRLRFAINTHWHFDHTDNNGSLRGAGATILAHENTKKRMSESHELPFLGVKLPPSPGGALPQRTFGESYRLQMNGETLSLAHIAPAHTDSDIYIHFERANVLHLGDTFFNGMYPYIDSSTGGNINGMIASAEKILGLADDNTRIVPGHGSLAAKADLIKYRDMLVAARDSVQQLKSSGRSVQDAVAAKPLAQLEPAWGAGFLNSDVFVQIIYATI
jgi:glyoxylase-like metal-dependent hydrolase (beta-lactamase superfamily II)